ncbi:MAG: ferrous iron transport protein B [Spirochaetales bacterium]|nr:ferrous iron transport protein B [Spirochaetales bacterium]
MESNKTLTVAIAGNPNSGKTTLFNVLTGAHQKTGNYPGVTVEKKEGRRGHRGYDLRFIDLPGTYSLTAYSLDEIVARDFLINEKPDVVLDVVDSTNLERNLFLCLQFQELGIPVVGALNMSDESKAAGVLIDEKRLSEVLRIPFVKTIGSSGKGVAELLDLVITEAERPIDADLTPGYGEEIEREARKLVAVLSRDESLAARYPIHWLAVKLIEKDGEARKIVGRSAVAAEAEALAAKSIAWIEKHFGLDAEIAVSEQRYGYIHGAVSEAVKRKKVARRNLTEAIDKVLINRFLGLPIFLFVLWGMFQLTFALGEYPLSWLEAFFGRLTELATAALPAGLVRSFVVDGLIHGVGGVLSFVPLIIILFLLISFLEDTGYMSRAAFVMDKFLHLFGLHGQSFMPLMIGFGCSVPAILAARTLKNPKDRIATILVTPFMSCGAKLPVYVLLAGAFFSRYAGAMVLSVYAIGVFLALVSAAVLKKTVLRGKAAPFVMELPPYRLPTLRGVLWHVWDKTWAYVKKAGTIILAASALVWAVTTFPRPVYDEAALAAKADAFAAGLDRMRIRDRTAALLAGSLDESSVPNAGTRSLLVRMRTDIASGAATLEDAVNARVAAAKEGYIEGLKRSEALENSLAGRFGRFIEPAFKPLGFNWKIGVASLTGFAAKELVVSTLGILYGTGRDASGEDETLRQALVDDPVFSPLSAYALMLFILILAPCAAAMAAIRAELGWKWLGFTVLYMTAASWLIAFLVFQIGSLAGLGA